MESSEKTCFDFLVICLFSHSGTAVIFHRLTFTETVGLISSVQTTENCKPLLLFLLKRCLHIPLREQKKGGAAEALMYIYCSVHTC